MVSLSESTNDEATTHDEFKTPPEEVQPVTDVEHRAPAVDRQNEVLDDDDDDKEGSVAADPSCADEVATVELGKDSDLGFSRLTPGEKIVAVSYVEGVGASEVSEPGIEGFRVSLRETKEASGELPSRKRKVHEENSGVGSPKGSLEIISGRTIKSLLKSPGNLNIDGSRHRNCNSTSPRDKVEDSLVKKKLRFPESEIEDTDGVPRLGEDPIKRDSDVDITKGEDVEGDKSNRDVSEGGEWQNIFGEDTEDFEKFKYIVGSVRYGHSLSPLLSEVPQVRRALPLSICRPVEDAATYFTGNPEEDTVLSVLNMLCEELDLNPKEAEETEKPDILEVAKRHGMTLPRPWWWPPSDSKGSIAHP